MSFVDLDSDFEEEEEEVEVNPEGHVSSRSHPLVEFSLTTSSP